MKRSILSINLILMTIGLLYGVHRPIGKVDAHPNSRPGLLPATTQSGTAEAEELNRLIVMITCQIGDDESSGAGIIFGKGNDRLYIATANHVVRRGTDEAQNVRVQLRWKLGEWKAAVLLSNTDRDADLAVLALDASSVGMPAEGLRWDQLSEVGALKKEGFVYSLGYPNGEAWRKFVTPDRVSQISLTSILFESNLVAPGNSGGALLNEQLELVGMIRDTGKALNIQSVIDTVSQWGYPVNLKVVGLSPDPFYLAADPSLVLKSSNIHGNLQLGKVYWQNEVWIGDRRYEHAVGMHAPDSGIAYADFRVPRGAKYFQTGLGLARDDKSPNDYGNAIGRIFLDNDRVWEGAVSGANAKHSGTIPVPPGTKRLRLEVDSQGTNWGDQTTWGDPHFSGTK